MCSAALCRIIPLLCLTSGVLAPQTSGRAPLPSPDPVIRVSVNLVQVDTVVTDAKGNHVADLQPDDFGIFEDGKPQKITNFSWIEVKPPASPGAPPSHPPGNLRKDEVHRSIVLMVDDLGTPYEDLPGVMASARKFVAEQMAPGDLVSVTASRGGMGFYQQFTHDKRQLYAAIDHIGQRPGFGQWVIETPRGVKLGPDEPPFGYRDANNPPNPIGYLTWAIQGLQDVPGRKAVVLLTHGFYAPPGIVNLANRAGVVIYVIDPHGTDFVNPLIPSNAPYRLLAAQTGGLWIKSLAGAELNADLGRVLEDMSGYYLIGYQPDRSDFELSNGQPVHHDILVKVRRPGLTVRARNGFMGVPNPSVKPPPKTREDYLQQALFSPFSASGIRLRLDPVYGASGPDPKTKRRLPVMRAMLSIEGGDLQFSDVDSGRRKLVLDVLVAVFNQDGTSAASQDQQFVISATQDQAAQLAGTGLHWTKDVKLPKPGPYLVRAAVRDAVSGAVGSAFSFLEAPDFNKPEIALSSIVLSGPSDTSGSGASSAPENAGQMGWAEFAAGTTVQFGCEVFGIKPVRPPAEPRVEMQVRLFREGATVFDSRPAAVSPALLSKNLLTGNLKIEGDMEPGDYAMQLIAYDRLASPKKQMASQWIDLTIVKPVLAPH
jgi:VWFA-related protein